jgi:hypothetical protein
MFNSPYELFNDDDFSYDSEAYVFDGYLRKKEQASVKNTSLTKAEYLKLKSKAKKSKETIRKITDFEKVKEILGNRIEWNTKFKDNVSIKTIVLDNGRKLKVAYECYFTKDIACYFPDYDVIRLESESSNDMCFNVKTGEFISTGGDPGIIIHSPNKKFRLIGYYHNQGCTDYFFQQKVGDFYYYISSIQHYEGCHFSEFHWLSDTEFIFKTEHNHYSGIILLPKK